MSDGKRIALVGATGLIGQAVLRAAQGSRGLTLLALARREVPDHFGAPVTTAVAEPARWPNLLAQFQPQVLICALGTTWRKAGRDEAVFRAVDYDLVLRLARAAIENGARQAVVVSSVGADPATKSFYLRVKGEMERDVARVGFKRLDILRPGLLRGLRGSDRRLKERAAIALSPLIDRLLPFRLSRYRSVAAEDVACAALVVTQVADPGTFIHHNNDIRSLASSMESG